MTFENNILQKNTFKISSFVLRKLSSFVSCKKFGWFIAYNHPEVHQNMLFSIDLVGLTLFVAFILMLSAKLDTTS